MRSSWIQTWRRSQQTEQRSVGWLCKAATICPWTAYQFAQTHFICLIWMRESVWGGCQSQPWHTDNILTPQVTMNPQNLSQLVWVYPCKGATLCPWTDYQCAQTLLCICLIWMWGSVWGGCQLQPWCNDIILTPQVTQITKIWAKQGGYNCVRRLLPYAYGKHINVLKHFICLTLT